jgi:hypothetical protein
MQLTIDQRVEDVFPVPLHQVVDVSENSTKKGMSVATLSAMGGAAAGACLLIFSGKASEGSRGRLTHHIVTVPQAGTPLTMREVMDELM